MSFYTDCHRSYLVRGIAQSLANLAVLTILAALLQTAGWPQELGSLPIDRAIPAALNHPKGTEDVTHSPCKVRFHKGKPTANVQFLPPLEYISGGYEPTAIAIGDINCDRHPDIVVGHHCSSFDACLDASTVGLLLGNGDGTFQPAVTYSSGVPGIVSLAIADVNDDGRPDLIILACGPVEGPFCLNFTNSRVSILSGNGDGTFQPPMTYDSGSVDATLVAVADLNGDGKPDIVAAHVCDNCSEGTVSILLGNGDGTFGSPVTYDSGGSVATSVAILDVNGDGKPDLLVGNGYACSSGPSCFNGPTGVVGVLLGNGDGTFKSAVSYSSGGRFVASVVVMDVNSDGKADLLVANDLSDGPDCGGLPCVSSIGVLLGNGDGTFQAPQTYKTGGCCAFSIVAMDLNGDGKTDVVAAHLQDSNVAILLGNGDGTLQPPVILSGSGVQNAGLLAVGDLDSNRMPDLVTAGVSKTSAIDTITSVFLQVGMKRREQDH
jgi:FG-GAP-like repeat